jgi:hypothetical protein
MQVFRLANVKILIIISLIKLKSEDLRHFFTQVFPATQEDWRERGIANYGRNLREGFGLYGVSGLINLFSPFGAVCSCIQAFFCLYFTK